MSSQLLNPDSPRGKLLWAMLAVVVVAQLVGIYMLCSEQVRQQQVRATQAQMQHMAVTDCLRYMPNSTIGSCARQASNRFAGDRTPASVAQAPVAQGANSMMATVLPVNFAFR